MRAARTPKPLQARNLRRKKREGEAGGARRGKSHSWQTFLVSPLMIPYVYPCIFFDNKDKKEKNVKVPPVLPSTFWYFTSTVANLLILKSVSAMSNIIFIGPQQKLIPRHHQQQKKTIFTTVISIYTTRVTPRVSLNITS
jgi:hypothetical protein